jgi:hypothetical protein
MLDSSHVIFAQSSFCPEPSLPITENIAQAFFDFRNVSGILTRAKSGSSSMRNKISRKVTTFL